MMAPRPMPRHQIALKYLSTQLDRAWQRHGWESVIEVDIILVDSFRPTVRAPDLVVTELTTLAEEQPLRAGDIVLAVEIISPGSVRTDRVHKLSEYQRARIPHYWIIELAETITLDAFTLAPDGYRQDITRGTGRVCVSSPAPMTINLDLLKRY